MSQVAAGNLLDESFHGSRFSSIRHEPPLHQKCGACLWHKLRGKPQSLKGVLRSRSNRSERDESRRSPGTKPADRSGDGGGGDSIQEYTAANPYYPPQKKTVGVRIRVSTHAQRSPSVRRHRRPILPNQSRVTARVHPRTGTRVSTRIASMSLRHFSKVPVSPFVVITHPGTTRECINDRPLPCRSVAQVQRRLPPSPSSASTQATLPLYGV